MEGVPPSVRPTRTKLDYDHGNITYQMLFSDAAGVMNTVSVFRGLSGTGEKKLIPISRRLDYQPLFGKMSPHSSPERRRIKDWTRETAEIEPR